jgi:hypothetical protein
VDTRYHELLDAAQGQAQDGPATDAIRTGILKSPSHYYRQLKRILGQGNASGAPPLGGPAVGTGDRLGRRRLFGMLLAFPDEQVWWLPPALLRGLREIR